MMENSLEVLVYFFYLEVINARIGNKFRILLGNTGILRKLLGKSGTVFNVCSEENKSVLRTQLWFPS